MHDYYCAECGVSLVEAYPDRPLWYIKGLTYCPDHRLVRRKRPEKSRPTAERFWERIDKNGPIPTNRPELGPCWVWMWGLGGKGYGHLARATGEKGSSRTHVISWEIHRGSVPDGLVVCHHCNNRPCVNPGHLYVGTQKENIEQRVAEGRNADQWGHRPYASMPGEANPAAKLIDEQVEEIRARYAAGGISQAELAKEYGVSQPHIGRLIRGDRWQ